MNTYLKASTNPLDDIQQIAYNGQSLQRRMYKSGYENFFEMLPVLTDDDQFLDLKTAQTMAVMDSLAVKLRIDPWTPTLQPLENDFNRTIIGMEQPTIVDDGYNAYGAKKTFKEGAEIVVSRWGNGFTSPVHGHADGYLYEQLLIGKMRVNTFFVSDSERRIARPLATKIYNGFENIAAVYTPHQQNQRSALLHNFTSIGYSVALHYLPEHTRDGRDNRFEVQYFDDFTEMDLLQLSAQQGIEQLHVGDVALVRSQNVPEYGDHFIVITGKPILKEHGLRPQEVAIYAPNASSVLDEYEPIMGLTLLKLLPLSKRKFHEFHDIKIVDGKVIFQNA